jgi:hypothetical protein
MPDCQILQCVIFPNYASLSVIQTTTNSLQLQNREFKECFLIQFKIFKRIESYYLQYSDANVPLLPVCEITHNCMKVLPLHIILMLWSF